MIIICYGRYLAFAALFVELQVLTVVIQIIFIRCIEILVTDMRRYIYKSA